jgi:Flp pilus assembly secretin CpaC
VVAVVLVSPKEILLNPKRLGRTNVFLWFGEARHEEWKISVELDFTPLREHLTLLNPGIRMEVSGDGNILLQGSVPTYEIMRAAVDVTARYIDGSSVEAGAGVVIADAQGQVVDEKKEPPQDKAPDKANEKIRDNFVDKNISITTPRVRNLLLVKELPATLQDRIQEIARSYSGDIRIKRLLEGVPRDASIGPLVGNESLMMEGTIANAEVYFQLLTLVDAILGGRGTDLNQLNLGANGIKSPVVRLANGRFLSFLKIQNVPALLEERLESAARAFSPNVRVRRIQGPVGKSVLLPPDQLITTESNSKDASGDKFVRTIVPVTDGAILQHKGGIDDALDSFLIEGSVANQSVYTRMLVVLDKMLGGDGESFEVIADDGGGLFANGNNNNAGQAGTSTDGGSGRGSSRNLTNNLSSNIGRSLVVRSDNKRLVSFVKVSSLPQVLVSVRVIEFNKNKLRDTGVDIRAITANFQPNPIFTGSTIPASPPLANSSPTSIQNVTNVVQGLLSNNLTFIESRFALDVSVNFLETKGIARTLSEPNLLTLSGETATFLVGTKVSFSDVVSTSSSSNQTIIQSNTRDETFGVKLAVRPIVGEDGTITLDVDPEISRLLNQSADSRTSSTSNLRTSVRLKSGQGLVLGGLISITDQENVRRPPVLGRIPGLGDALSKKVKTSEERELVFVLIPRIIEPQPEEVFALEPPTEFPPVRGGVISKPELGRNEKTPKFKFLNAGVGEPLSPNPESPRAEVLPNSNDDTPPKNSGTREGGKP